MTDEGFGAIDGLKSHICFVDCDGVIVAVNRAWTSFGRENAAANAAGFVGSNYLEICRNAKGRASAEARDVFEGLRAVLSRDRELFEIEYPCHSPVRKRWFRACISPRWRSSVAATETLGAIVSHVEITERKRAEEDFARLSAADPLTGLPDSRFFAEAAQVEIELSRRFGEATSMLVFTVDNLREVRETFGEAAEREVLHSVALLCRAKFGERAMLALAGPRHFVCLAPGPAAMAIVLAETLRVAIEMLPIAIWSQLISVTASVGVTAVDDSDPTVGGPLFRAEEALRQAQAAGGNRVKSLMKRHPESPLDKHVAAAGRAPSSGFKQ